MTHFIRVKYLTINDINPDDLLRGLENYVLLNYELIVFGLGEVAFVRWLVCREAILPNPCYKLAVVKLVII
jgi:hypothetical protein